MRRMLGGVSAAIVLATLGLGAGGATASTATVAKPRTGGTLTISTRLEIPSMDPVRGPFSTATDTGGDKRLMVFGTLMRLSKTGAVLPGLAESLTTKDAITWTMKLRPNVKFSDGTPLDADAVVFNLNRFKDPSNAYTGAGLVNQITKTTVVDSTTLEFVLIQANGSFPMVFGETTGMMGSPAAINADPRNWGAKPVGAGAYVVKEWVRDSSMTFVRNPNYYDKPRPYIDTIVYKIIPNATTQANELRAGTIDAINGAFQADQLKVAVDEPKAYKSLDPTASGGAMGVVCNLERAPCNDVRFREAVSLSLDYQRAREVLAPGVPFNDSFLECPPFGPGSPYCAKGVKIKYNPTKATKLVDQLKADGITPEMGFSFNTVGPYGVTLGEFVQQSLAKVGIKVNLVPLSSNTEFIDASTRHTFHSVLAYQQPALTPLTRFYNDYHSVGGPNAGRDMGNLRNKALDVALEKMAKSPKLADQIEGAQEAQRIIAKEFLVAWFIPYFNGVVTKSTFHLPDWVSPNANVYRYEEAWLSGKR